VLLLLLLLLAWRRLPGPVCWLLRVAGGCVPLATDCPFCEHG
jgi:hypothetical protein